MATFISLVNFTQQGVAAYKDSPQRAAKFRAMAEKAGAKVEKVYWTMGSHDAVVLMDAADAETAAAVMLGLSSLGNVKTQTMRAFDAAEIKEIIAKVPG